MGHTAPVMAPITSDLQNLRVRFDAETLERLKVLAVANRRSVPAQIRWIVERYMEQVKP